MKKLFKLTVIAISALTLISCAGKSKNAETSISKEESVIKPAATETNDMAAKFMKSAELLRN